MEKRKQKAKKVVRRVIRTKRKTKDRGRACQVASTVWTPGGPSLLYVVPRKYDFARGDGRATQLRPVCPARRFNGDRVVAQDGRAFLVLSRAGSLREIGRVGARGRVIKNGFTPFRLPIGNDRRMVEVVGAGHRTVKQMEAVRALLPQIEFACCDPFSLKPREKRSRAKPRSFGFAYYDRSDVLRWRLIAASGRTLREVIALDVVTTQKKGA